jgi:hypothetical protein
VLACDLLTVETAFLQGINILFFISLAARRIEYVACLRIRPNAGSAPFAPTASIESSSSAAATSSMCPASTAATKTSTSPHRGLRLQPPDGREPTPLNATDRLRRRDLLGGLIHEYDGT